MFLAPFLAASLSVFSLVSGLECPFESGATAKFSYSIEKDQDNWIGKYNFNKRKGGLIYQQRRIYYGNRKIINNRRVYINAANNIGFPPQQIQQQRNFFPQQQERLDPKPSEDATTEIPLTTTEKPEPLPVWKLTVPRHATKVIAMLLEDGGTSENFELTEEEFSQENITTFSGFKQTVDVTDQEIVDGWYLICMDLATVVNGAKLPCTACTMARACASESSYLCDLETMDMSLSSRFQNEKALLVKYQVKQLPLPNATLTTHVFFNPEYRRCAPEFFDKPVSSVETTIFANSLVHVTVDGLKKEEAYTLKTDMKLKLNDGREFMLKNYPSASKDAARCRYNDKHSKRLQIVPPDFNN